MLFGSFALKAQVGFHEATFIAPFKLDITFHKTSLLIFPAGIQSADRGGSYVLAEKVKGSENVLKVKAAQKDFEQSNLQVITVDGKVYAFTVNYADTPAQLTIDLRKQPPYAPVTFKGLSLNDKEIESYAGIIAATQPFLKKQQFSRYGLKLWIEGIYVKDDVLFFRYHLKNRTSLKYEAASLRFYTRDKKKSKRTAVQDRESEPVFVLRKGLPEDPAGQTIIAAFPRFTIAEGKYFAAELMESNGDRNPFTRTTQKLLLKARVLR
jgi:conjugative transposon TraN protein